MRWRMIGVALAAVAMMAAGCKLTRKNYQAVGVGQETDQVRQVLGEPQYTFEGRWVYTRDEPRDLTMVEIYFDPDGRVIGKAWQNPEKPWENHREGRVPGA